MFRLAKEEKQELVTNCDRLDRLKHSSALPRVFTEQGVAMLSSVLRSERAIHVNIQIMRVFTRLRQMVVDNEELRCTFIDKGDVLVARMPDPLGRACIFPGDKKTFVTVVDVCIIRPGNDDISKRWLMYFINAPAFRAAVASLESGSTRKRISRKNLARISFPVPPSDEQKRIVAEIEKQFSRLDEAVDNLKRVKVNLKRYKASVLKAAVEGKLTEEWRKKHPDVEPADKLLERILAERRKK
jgi:type I restriction enzyme S subunit